MKDRIDCEMSAGFKNKRHLQRITQTLTMTVSKFSNETEERFI